MQGKPFRWLTAFKSGPVSWLCEQSGGQIIERVLYAISRHDD